MMRKASAMAMVLLGCAWGIACGPRTPRGGRSGGESGGLGAPAESGSVTETREVIVEKTPTGTRTTTITHTVTHTTVAAPPPPDRPADPLPKPASATSRDDVSALVAYNLQRLNAYRAAAGVPALKYDATISDYALAGSRQLSNDHAPHAHFRATIKGAPGFGSKMAENQGDWNGVPVLDATDAANNGRLQVDAMLKLMFDEGPGGGHHDNMLNPTFRRVGIGLVVVGGLLYMTNDFSD